jgi:hypothetical protein
MRPMRDIRLDPDVRNDLRDGAFLIAVPLITLDHKARFNVMMDTGLVAGIDSVAKAAGVSRSEFISHTLRQRLEAEIGAVVVDLPAGGTDAGRVGTRKSNRAAAARLKSRS